MFSVRKDKKGQRGYREMKKYNVADFGALPGTGKTVTGSLQSALDTCFLSGGGIVEIPCGEYLTGGLRLRSNTELHLCAGAKLIGTRNPEDYNILGSDTVEPVDLTAGYATKWNNGLIRILKAENVKITGEDDSLICGSNCYDPTGEENYRGPHAISCWFSKNLSFSGYTVRDSANWAHSIWHSENIMADNLHVYAGHDGFHIRGCKNTEIRSSDFITGDDAIAGHGNVNVLVADCNLNTACSAFRFGATNLLVERCRFFGPAKYPWRGCLTDSEKINGSNVFSRVPPRLSLLSMFTYFAENVPHIKEEPRNVVFKDCVVENAERLVQYNFSGGDKWQQHWPLFDLTLQNVTVTGITEPIVLYAPPTQKLSPKFISVNISTAESYRYDSVFQMANFAEFELKDCSVKTKAPHLIKCWSEPGKLIADNFDCSIPEEDYIIECREPFYSLDI
jgi:hypothetical protein